MLHLQISNVIHCFSKGRTSLVPVTVNLKFRGRQYRSNTGPEPGFAKRGGRVSKLRENWLIWPQNRLNFHDLVVKGGGGAESAHTWIRPCKHANTKRSKSFTDFE